MVTFKIVRHMVRHVEVVEIWHNGDLLGTLYPQEWGVRLVSKYLREESINVDLEPPVAAINVKLP